MKIKRIVINNIGPYVGANIFLFDVTSNKRRIVLIGGKNGTGKTTLFSAIKTCIYGCMAYGFESTSTRYYAEIAKLVNEQERHKKVGYAQLVMELLLDDGKDNHLYTFDRSWRITDKRIVEKFDVYKDGVILSQIEKSDFESYLFQLLPPQLFRFYFFDGEKISDLAFNNNKNSDFREAFLKLSNLDTMEIIRENFLRVSRGKAGHDYTIFQEYERCLETYHFLTKQISALEEDYKAVVQEIEQADDQLSFLEKEYAKGGGISKKEWKEMQETIGKEELRRDDQKKWLKDVANNILPFLILKTQLEQLKDQIALEHKAQVDANVRNAIKTPELMTIIGNFMSSIGGVEYADVLSQKLVNEIAEHIEATSQVVPILNLSDFDRFELTGKINGLLSFDIGKIKSATEDINASLNHVKRIRKKMEQSNIEDYDAYLQKRSEINEKKASLMQNLVDINRELQACHAQKTICTARLSKTKNDYEALLRKRSIHDLSARALLAFDELQTDLYRKCIQLVEKEFNKDFALLINKSDLVDGIHIDDNLNVFPYKNVSIAVTDLKRAIAKNGEEYLISHIGQNAYEVFIKSKANVGSTIVLPVEIRKQLSAGEKQVFIMALYQALSKLNKTNVPFIIDTPFARIDKEHRKRILDCFFRRLNGQVIILSTDEEIVNEYQTSIADIVSDTYILQHTEKGSTEVLPNTYFGGNK